MAGFLATLSEQVEKGKLDADALTTLYKRYKGRRAAGEADIRIQQAAYENHTRVVWDKVSKRVRYITGGEADGEQQRYLTRIDLSQIGVHCRTLLGKLLKERPTVEAITTGDTTEDVEAAEYGEALWNNKWDEDNLADKLYEVELWAFIAGWGFWEVYYDHKARRQQLWILRPHATVDHDGPVEKYQGIPFDANTGEELEVLPAGEPVTDEDEEKFWKQWASENEVRLETKRTFEGDTATELVSPLDLILIGSDDPKKAHAAIKATGRSVDWVFERYKKKIKANAESDQIQTSYERHPDEADLVMVYEIYVPPCDTIEEGLYAVWAEDTILQHGEYPYAHGRLPFIRFDGLTSVGKTKSLSLVRELMPVQKALNHYVSRISDYINKTLRPQILAAEGQLPMGITDEPGAIITWTPNGQVQTAPTWSEVPSLPSYVFQWIDVLMSQMNDISGAHEITQGKSMTNVDSSVAMLVLQEADETRMSKLHASMERSLSEAATQHLLLAQQFYDDPRTKRIEGPNGPGKVEFMNEDIEGLEGLRMKPGSSLPHSKAHEQLQISKLIDRGPENGGIDLRQALPSLDTAATNHIKRVIGIHSEKQRQEIREASESLQTDGQPSLEDPDDLVDDHLAHIEVLTLYMANRRVWKFVDPAVKAVLRDHLQKHKEMLSAANTPPPEPIPTTLSLKGDATPEFIAKAAQQRGVEVDPEILANEEMDRRDHTEQTRATAQAGRQIAIQEAERQAPPPPKQSGNE